MAEICPGCGYNTLDNKGKLDKYFYLYKCVRMECSYQEKRRIPFELLPTEEKLNILYVKLVKIEKILSNQNNCTLNIKNNEYVKSEQYEI